MISWLLAIAVFVLGAKAFTPAGIPLTREKSLHGTPGIICGVACILLGLLLVLDGLFGLAGVFHALSRLPSRP